MVVRPTQGPPAFKMQHTRQCARQSSYTSPLWNAARWRSSAELTPSWSISQAASLSSVAVSLYDLRARIALLESNTSTTQKRGSPRERSRTCGAACRHAACGPASAPRPQDPPAPGPRSTAVSAGAPRQRTRRRPQHFGPGQACPLACLLEGARVRLVDSKAVIAGQQLLYLFLRQQVLEHLARPARTGAPSAAGHRGAGARMPAPGFKRLARLLLVRAAVLRMPMPRCPESLSCAVPSRGEAGMRMWVCRQDVARAPSAAQLDPHGFLGPKPFGQGLLRARQGVSLLWPLFFARSFNRKLEPRTPLHAAWAKASHNCAKRCATCPPQPTPLWRANAGLPCALLTRRNANGVGRQSVRAGPQLGRPSATKRAANGRRRTKRELSSGACCDLR